MHPSAKREYYYPIEHIVERDSTGQISKNHGSPTQRVAFDYASQPITVAAIERAAEKPGTIVSTEFFDIRPDTLSFALIASIYGSPYYVPRTSGYEFVGSVVMEIDANTYFLNALNGTDDNAAGGSTTFATDSQIVFSIVDTHSDGKENAVYESSNYAVAKSANYEPMMTQDIIINIADRNIAVKFATVPGFGGSMQTNLPLMVLLVALLLSVLAFVLIIVLLTQKARAEEIAERMTASQRRILDTSRDIIAVVNEDGKWLSMNPTSLLLLGAEPNKVIGTDITNYFYDSKGVEQWRSFLSSGKENERVDIQMKSKNDKGFIWMSWSFTHPATEKLVYAIGRDVTLEKAAGEEIKLRSKQIELANTFEQEAAATKVHLMIQLSHEMRNQLTSMMGYLQLITAGAYDNDEELQTYAGSAYEGAESAFSFIHDMSEATIGDNDTMSKVEMHTVGSTMELVVSKYKSDKKQILNIQFAESSKNAHVIVDKDVIGDAWSKIFDILTAENAKNAINVTATENKLEGVTEIVIEASSNKDLARLIDTYNADTSNVIGHLREDSDDILLNIAKSASFIARMMGTFNIESMDDGKTAYIFISLPLVLRTQG
jgi:PAS domain S-box-containing protein